MGCREIMSDFRLPGSFKVNSIYPSVNLWLVSRRIFIFLLSVYTPLATVRMLYMLPPPEQTDFDGILRRDSPGQ